MLKLIESKSNKLDDLLDRLDSMNDLRLKILEQIKKDLNCINAEILEKPLDYKNLKDLINTQNKLDSTCDLKDLSSTLLFVAIKDERCLIGHLGDGAIGALYGDKLKVISNPDNGEYANQTFFITTKNAHKALRLFKEDNIKEKDIKAFVLMSDGSTEGLYSKKDKKFVDALQTHIIEITKQDKEKKQKDIEELIQKVRETKSFDDCSIAILAKCINKSN